MTGRARQPAAIARRVPRRTATERTTVPDAFLPPLPIGRLRDRTLRLIATAGRVYLRSGPWVPLEEDDSRVIRITGVDDLLFGRNGARDPERRRRSETRRPIRKLVRGSAPRRRVRGRTRRRGTRAR